MTIYDVANRILRGIGIAPDAHPHATSARALIDRNGAIIAAGDTAVGPVPATRAANPTAGNLATLDALGNVVDSGIPKANPIPFFATGFLTSAAAAAGLTLVPDAAIPAGRKLYIAGFVAKVNGGTAWGTTATVALQDSSAVSFFSIAVAALTANAELRPGSANITAGNAYVLGQGGTVNKGLQVVGNANGTGSNLQVTVHGYFI